MVWRILLLLVAFIPLTTQAKDVPPKIKVLVAHDQNSVMLDVTDKYKIIDPHVNESVTNWRFKGKSQNIQALRGGIKWGEEFPGVHQLAFIAGSPDTQFIVNNIPYTGVIYVYDIGGTISVVNELPIEDYLASILANKYQGASTEETLAALVIAVRTHAYHHVKNPKSDFWDIDAAAVEFKGKAPEKLSNHLRNALIKTRYMVLSLNGKLDDNIKTFPAQWDSKTAKISIAQANEMAVKGEHAATILEKAFPKTSIQLIYFENR